jgi:hypothetical protein
LEEVDENRGGLLADGAGVRVDDVEDRRRFDSLECSWIRAWMLASMLSPSSDRSSGEDGAPSDWKDEGGAAAEAARSRL